MRTTRCGVLVAVVAGLGFSTTAAHAQSHVQAEIGTQAGVTFLHSPSPYQGTQTTVAVPGGSILGQPTIYAAIFPSPRFSIEPQLFFVRQSNDYSSAHMLEGALRVAGYLDDASHSPYVVGDVAFSNGLADYAFGVGLGYRAVLGRWVALRPEAHFRKWSNEGPSEIALLLSFGVLVPPRQ